MGIQKRVKPGRLLVLGLALLAVTLALAWGQAGQPSAWAEEEGPRLAFNLDGLNATCDAPSEPSECTVPLGGFFTLKTEVIEAPAAGYIVVQSFIDWGSADYDPELDEDETGDAGTCGDGIDNLNDYYGDRADPDCYVFTLALHHLAPGEETVWPDLGSPEVALRRVGQPGYVNYSALTGLVPPLPVSDYEGTVVEIVVECSADESSTRLELIPLNEERAAGHGTGFVESDGTTQVPSKGDFLTINCEEVIVVDASPTPEGPAATATPGPRLPTTGSFGDLNGDGGGQNAGLWAAIGVLLAASALALALFPACRRAGAGGTRAGGRQAK